MAIIWRAGMRLTAARLNASPRGEIAYANRSQTPGLTLPTTLSTVALLRLDGVALMAGHTYLIRAPRLRWDVATTTDRARWEIRISTNGAATTSTPIAARGEMVEQNSISVEAIRHAAVAETVSVLLSITRTAGTSAGTVAFNDDGGADLVVEHIGESAPDTAIIP